MRAAVLHEMSSDELEAKLKELQEVLFRFRFQTAMGQLDAPIKMRTTKRDIAKIFTILGERQKKINKYS